MKREIITTQDGSVTIYLPEMQETYHSKFGAIQESYHVFIKNGLDMFNGRPIAILEMGFGTGLNALVTFFEASKSGQHIHYTGVEAYPVVANEVAQLNYATQLQKEGLQDVFTSMHNTAWETDVQLADNFILHKRKQFFEEIDDVEAFDLIYFDAFGYPTQPDLWGETIFNKMFTALKPGGILVTYACRTIVKKAMQAAGFTTKKLPGAPGKREMLQAIKQI